MGQTTPKQMTDAEAKKQFSPWQELARGFTVLASRFEASSLKIQRSSAIPVHLYQAKLNGEKGNSKLASIQWESHGSKEQAGKHASVGWQSLGLLNE